MQAAVDSGYITDAEARGLPFGKPGNGREQDIDWTDGLRRNANGSPYGDESNIMHALRHAPLLYGCVRYNEFFNRIEVARELFWRTTEIGDQWTDADDLNVMAWLQRQNIAVRGKASVADCIALVARDHPYHPVRHYLNGLEWDGGSRLYGWLQRYLKADGDADYLAAVGTAFLVSAVARIFEPGCQADHVLVLEGEQGVGKTRTLQTLGYPWTTDSLPDLHSKDAAVQLHGVWLCELAELAALRRSEIEATKAFISRRVDRYRPPYGRHAIEVPRQCVFIATTNEMTYLLDPTGNRRFWPVRIQAAGIDTLANDRDKLWAEAVELYRQGRQWFLSGDDERAAEQEQEKRQLRSETEQAIADYLLRLEDNGTVEVTTKQVFENALGLTLPEDALKARRYGVEVANAITNCGWRRQGVHGRGESRRVIYRLPHSDS
jgi:predicted P-loop ATPase